MRSHTTRALRRSYIADLGPALRGSSGHDMDGRLAGQRDTLPRSEAAPDRESKKATESFHHVYSLRCAEARIDFAALRTRAILWTPSAAQQPACRPRLLHVNLIRRPAARSPRSPQYFPQTNPPAHAAQAAPPQTSS